MVKLVLSDYDRSKIDESNDKIFYSQPKFAHHLDNGFRTSLQALNKELINPDSIVLDLMSSWLSHLPEDVSYKKVIGHGMNEEELSRNQFLDQYWVQDFNIDFLIPLADRSIDYVLIAAGWQYLQYPEYMAHELKRVVKPGGKLLISFTNRAFWHKTPKIWAESSSQKRLTYIRTILESQDWVNIRVISQVKTKKFLGIFNQNIDPFYGVLAIN